MLTKYQFNEYPKELQKKVTLLEHFKSYLKSSTAQQSASVHAAPPEVHRTSPCLRVRVSPSQFTAAVAHGLQSWLCHPISADSAQPARLPPRVGAGAWGVARLGDGPAPPAARDQVREEPPRRGRAEAHARGVWVPRHVQRDVAVDAPQAEDECVGVRLRGDLHLGGRGFSRGVTQPGLAVVSISTWPPGLTID